MMPAIDDRLTIDPPPLATMAEIAGVVALAPGDAPDTLNLNKLFVEPRLSAAASAGRYSRTPSPRRVNAAPSG
jgi:hypothetical protein